MGEADEAADRVGEECWVRGRSLELSGRLAEAVEAYREALRRAPRAPSASIPASRPCRAPMDER